ncbi:4643_t:CDS:2, partial [Entrophospora sp. SA101]
MKNARRRLTEDETLKLNKIFETIQKPDSNLRTQLAKQLNMSSRAIQVWFQNRRAKLKRDAMELKSAADSNRNSKPKKLTLAVDYCKENHLNSVDIVNSIIRSSNNINSIDTGDNINDNHSNE